LVRLDAGLSLKPRLSSEISRGGVVKGSKPRGFCGAGWDRVEGRDGGSSVALSLAFGASQGVLRLSAPDVLFVGGRVLPRPTSITAN